MHPVVNIFVEEYPKTEYAAENERERKRTITCADEGRVARLEREGVNEKVQEFDVSFLLFRVRNVTGESTR